MVKNKTFRHLSLFSGCGGIDLGFLGGFKIQTEFIFPKKKTKGVKLPKNKFKTVFANDIKKELLNFWKKNLLKDESIFHLGSVVDLVKQHNKTKKIFPNNIDVLTGGFPCQDFSVSGLRKGFGSHKSHLNKKQKTKKNETRGKLYLWMKEVIRITNPKIFIAENVRGLVNMDGVLNIIKNDFKNTGSGYKIFSKELYAPDHGIPQSRRRIFIIGINQDFIKKNKIKLTDNDLFPDIEFSSKQDLFIKNLYPKSKIFFRDLKEPENETKDLSQQFYSKAKYNKGTQGQTEVNEKGIAPTIRSEHHGNIEFRYLDKKNGGKNSTLKKQRRLTVRECARIQTFPDWYQFSGKRTTGGTRRAGNPRTNDNYREGTKYTQIGNAVPVKLAKEMGLHLKRYLGIIKDTN